MPVNEEEWKREDGSEPQNPNDILSEDGHHSLKPVQHAERF
jgi:hypothetical protein